MEDFVSSIADMVRDAERYSADRSRDRVEAEEYYKGEMKDLKAVAGRSSMVSKDVRVAIKRALPSLMRTLLGADRVVEYQPVNDGDEEQADQATDYINLVVLPETNARTHIENAIHDALLHRNGILKAWFEEKKLAQTSLHTGLDDEAFIQLVSDESVEVLEHTQRTEMIDDGMMPSPVVVHDVKIKAIKTQRRLRVSAVPLERFLIHPDAVDIETSPIVGECTTIRRSDLIAMGYDAETVKGLPVKGADDYEELVRRDLVAGNNEPHWANEEVDYYDLYVRFDFDGDGITELRHMCFAGGLSEKNLLLNEGCEASDYYDLKVMTKPHFWEGISLFDDLKDIQRVKTAILRQTLDNIYWQNRPQPIIRAGLIKNLDAVYNPEFGLPIEIADGVDPSSAIQFTQVPFVAAQSFNMLGYFDQEAQARSGISDASSGLSADALQNMTAKASAMIEQAGIGQVELMARTLAEGLKGFFKGLLRLTIAHADVPRTVRLRGRWVKFDPRTWNAEMDCQVSTGLGAGTRERDMMAMMQVIGLQEKLVANLGADNPFVKPDNVYNAISRLVEAAGLRTPSMYFSKPDETEIQRKQAMAQQMPTPEQVKVQAQMQIEQMRLQAQQTLKASELEADLLLEEKRMAVARDKELAQMEADLEVKRAEIIARKEAQADQANTDLAKERMRLEWEREKLARTEALEREKMYLSAETARNQAVQDLIAGLMDGIGAQPQQAPQEQEQGQEPAEYADAD